MTRISVAALAIVAAGCATALSAPPPTTTPSASTAPSDAPTVTTVAPRPAAASVGAKVPREPARAATTTAPPVFTSSIEVIDAEIAARMTASWRAGCPVGLDELRLVVVSHHTFDGSQTVGEIVVAASVAEDLVGVFEALFNTGYPIERMELVDVYGGDDDQSMAANNTSAFNCRTVSGTNRWSQHAYGLAIDINPLYNPYVRGSQTAPPGGAQFADRTIDNPALIRLGDAVVEAFAAIGWSWGGLWLFPDYQHFSRSGR